MRDVSRFAIVNGIFFFALANAFSQRPETLKKIDSAEVQKHADVGDAKAQNELGNRYSDELNYLEAVTWYLKAAQQGYAPAQENLGLSYLRGWGVRQDHEQAFSWLHKAAEAGLASAQFYLGYMLGTGRGTSVDYVEAAKWYRRSSDQGFVEAKRNLALYYQDGTGVKKDLDQARSLMQNAADNGDQSAQAWLTQYKKEQVRKSSANEIAKSSTSTNNDVFAGGCKWSRDFGLIRDAEMLNTLKNQDFAQKLAQGGSSVDQQIAAGEAALSQISATLPTIESTIRGISQPTITHYNFRFNYDQTCKRNSESNALLAAECQHVNVENARYALNGTLQIMDCMAGRAIRPDIGPNPDSSMPQDEVAGAINSNLVNPSASQSNFQCPKPGSSGGDILPKECQTPEVKPGPPSGRRTQ